MTSDGLQASLDKMREAGLGGAALETFRHYYEQLVAGETGLLPEDEIEPLDDLPEFDTLAESDATGVLDETVVIKLNGGLGTSMGMTGPKSLLEVKDSRTFLDIIAGQVLELRRRSGARLPLVLMNSFATRDASLEALARHPELELDLPADFVQSKEPKLRADDLSPVEWPDNPSLEWCPPGHGDLYTALQTSGMLDRMRERGYRYAFVSNVDNLGAVLEPRILAWFADSGAPFASEAIDRTQADRKGGHLARRRDGGGLVLRETAQVREEDQEAFEDVCRHRFFNANNLWIDLQQLADALAERDHVLGLPVIVNPKTVDPSDKSSPRVIQLETAMGAAVGVFEGACALRVPRRRFTPVKTTSDLLILRSDAYELTPEHHVVLADGRERAPFVELGEEFKLVDDFDARFPKGPPSLAQAERLKVCGDVTFGANVVVRGCVEITGPREIEDGAVLEGPSGS